MKCHKCGADNVDNAKYCIHCGEKLTVASVLEMDEILNDLDNITNESPSTPEQYSVDLNNIKDISDNELINQLNRAYNILKEAYVYYGEAATIQRNLNLNKIHFDYKKYTPLLIKGVIKFSILTLLSMPISAHAWIPFAILYPFFVFGYLIYRLIKFVKVLSADEKNTISIYRDRAIQLNEKGNNIIRNNLEALSVLPNDYWLPKAIENIMNSLKFGRAKDLKEALYRISPFSMI